MAGIPQRLFLLIKNTFCGNLPKITEKRSSDVIASSSSSSPIFFFLDFDFGFSN